MRRLLQASCQLSLHCWLAYMLHKSAISWFSWFSTTLHSTHLFTHSFTFHFTHLSTHSFTLHSTCLFTRSSTLHSTHLFTHSSTLHSTHLFTRSFTLHSTCLFTYSFTFHFTHLSTRSFTLHFTHLFTRSFTLHSTHLPTQECRSRDSYQRSHDLFDHSKLIHTLTLELIHRFQSCTNHYSYNSQIINKSLIIAMSLIKKTDAYVVYQILKTRSDWHSSWVKNKVSKAFIVTWINLKLIEN